MESEAMCIDKYLLGDVAERFNFLYENYSVLKPLIKNYREEIIMDVIEMKSYNRRANCGDLGVRVQVSLGISNPTANQAISNISIAKAVDEGFLDDEFFEDTDDPDELVRRVTIYHVVTRDYQTFISKLETLDPLEQRVLKPYLLREKSMADLAEDMGIDYRSAVKKVYRIKKRLSLQVEPRLRRGA